MSEDEKIYVKAPVFNGDKKKWPVFKTKMRSYLAQKGMSDILTYKPTIIVDSKTYTEDDLKLDSNKTKVKMRDMNRKAAGLLLSSIDTESELGESAFSIVEAYVDPDAGYAGGQFLKAWKAMEKRYEDQDTVDVADLKQNFYDKKMKDGERPSLFIDKLNKMRKRLANEMSYKMDESDYLKNILAKLPKGKGKDDLGPYQVEKRRILDKIDGTTNYGLEDLVRDLERAHKDVHGSEEENSDSDYDEAKTDRALPAFTKQFKGLCRKCGKMGHMAKNCTENQSRFNNNRNFHRGGGRGHNRGGRGRGRGFRRGNN